MEGEVHEHHGIFQFSDDFFPAEKAPEQMTLPEYTARSVSPKVV